MVLVGGALIAACSLVVDTGGLSGGSGVTDGGGESGSVAMDATSSESGTAIDAGSGGRYCERFEPAGSVRFCDDFDDPGRTDVTVGWTRTNIDKTGKVLLAPARGLSPPNAMEVIWPANLNPPDGDCNYARLVQDMPTAVSKFTVGFDVLLGDGDFYDEAVTNLVWEASASPKYCQLYLRSLLSAPGLDDDAHERPLTKPITAGAWHRIEITIDGTTGGVSILVDGENGFTTPQTIPPGCQGTMKVSLAQGLFCARKNPSQEHVLYDNVTFDGQ